MPSQLEVFVRLVGEGTPVWRPVPAVHVSDGMYRLGGAQTPDEQWEFEPGTVVRCAQRRFSDGTEGLAAIAPADFGR